MSEFGNSEMAVLDELFPSLEDVIHECANTIIDNINHVIEYDIDNHVLASQWFRDSVLEYSSYADTINVGFERWQACAVGKLAFFR